MSVGPSKLAFGSMAFAAFAIAASLAAPGPYNAAYAYSIAGGTNASGIATDTGNAGSGGGGASGLSVGGLVQTFMNGADWLIRNGGPAPVPANWTGQSVLQWLDLWIYSVAGFHVISYSNLAINLMVWLIGAAKAGIAWIIYKIPPLRVIVRGNK